MKRGVLHCMCGALVMAACQADKPKSLTRDEVLAADSTFLEPSELVLSGEGEQLAPVAMDELFDDFFFNYATDVRVQKARTNFPLHFNAFGCDMAIEREEWQQQVFFTDPDFYTVFLNSKDDMDLFEATDRTAVDVQLINAMDSTLCTFHFDRLDGKWKLTRKILGDLAEDALSGFYFFYHAFSSDSIFQQQSIARSLRFITTDSDDDFSTIEGTLTPEQWFVFRPDMAKGVLTNILYGQTYSNPSHIVMLQRGISNGMLDIFTFTRRDGDWKLTAYEN